MRLEQVENQLCENNLLDKQKIYIYASLIGGAGALIGRTKGLMLLSVCEDTLYIHRANIDNSYGEQFAKISISKMQDVKGKAGLFGGKLSFNADGRKYNFKLPSKAGKFVDFFVK